MLKPREPEKSRAAVIEQLRTTEGKVPDYKIEANVRAQGIPVSRDHIAKIRKELGYAPLPKRPYVSRGSDKVRAAVVEVLKASDGKINNQEIRRTLSRQGLRVGYGTIMSVRKAEGFPAAPTGGAGHAPRPTHAVPIDVNGALRQVVGVLKGMGVIEFHYKDGRMTIVRSQTVEVE